MQSPDHLVKPAGRSHDKGIFQRGCIPGHLLYRRCGDPLFRGFYRADAGLDPVILSQMSTFVDKVITFENLK